LTVFEYAKADDANAASVAPKKIVDMSLPDISNTPVGSAPPKASFKMA
jgi:hypothetical protein